MVGLGAVINSQTVRLLTAALPSVKGEVIKTGKRGRPVSTTLAELAADYTLKLPETVTGPLTDNPELIAGFVDAYVAARRDATDEENEAIAGGRDAQAMNLLDGEPVQSDTFLSFPVIRGEDETLGRALRRDLADAFDMARIFAKKRKTEMYVFVTRYAWERNYRDEATAKKYGLPLSGVGLPSRNILGIIVTDNGDKAYTGVIARAGVVTAQTPEPTPKGKGKAKAATSETVPVISEEVIENLKEALQAVG